MILIAMKAPKIWVSCLFWSFNRYKGVPDEYDEDSRYTSNGFTNTLKDH